MFGLAPSQHHGGATQWRLRDLSFRTKLLILVGLPILHSVVLLVFVGWGQKVWSEAYADAIHWRQHVVVVKTIEWSAAAYVDGVSDLFLSGTHLDQALTARRELQQSTAASLRTSKQFALKEQEDERRLASMVSQLLAQGQAVGRSKERMADVRALYEGPLMGMIHRRVADEEKGAEQALAHAQRIGRWVWTGGLGSLACILLAVIAASLLVARALERSVSDLQNHMRQVAGGNLETPLEIEARDEIGQLALSAKHMAAELRDQRRNQYGFLAAVAHDLRNPLAVLRVASDALLKLASLSDEASVRKAVVLIDRQVERMSRMTGDLLDAAKIEAGQLELQVDVCDLRVVAAEVADSYADTSAMHRIDLALPQEPLLVRCDSTRIAQVLHNLLSNAIKYSPQGGRVGLAVSSHGDHVVMSVTDQGVGIDPAELDAIFAPFHRGSMTEANVAGTGLGLAISKRIVTAHGGSIDVQSEKGRGTSFQIRLPSPQM